MLFCYSVVLKLLNGLFASGRADYVGLSVGRGAEKTMETIGKRISERRKVLGLSQDELAKLAGYKGQSGIREIEVGAVRKPGKILELASALRVRPEWLASGVGEMLEEEAMDQVRLLVGAHSRQLYEGDEKMDHSEFFSVFSLVPRYAVQAGAGPGMEVHSEQIVDHLAFKTEWLKAAMGLMPEKLALITARGDSMEPAIGDGDLMLLDMRELRTLDPSIYVVRMDQSLVAKRLQLLMDGRVRINSDNPMYGSETVRYEEIQILGRVVWIGRKV